MPSYSELLLSVDSALHCPAISACRIHLPCTVCAFMWPHTETTARHHASGVTPLNAAGCQQVSQVGLLQVLDNQRHCKKKKKSCLAEEQSLDFPYTDPVSFLCNDVAPETQFVTEVKQKIYICSSCVMTILRSEAAL